MNAPGTIAAVILAAGFGTRLAPLTDRTPKPLLVVGHQPVASHLLARLTQVPGLDRVVVVINDRHRDQWNDWQQDVPSHPTVELVSNGVVTNEERHGAVADLARGVERVGDADWIIVLAGDNLLDEPLGPHIAAALHANQPVVLCRDLGDSVPAGRFGEVTIDDDHMITRFREKPATPESPLAATCSYVLPAAAAGLLASYLVAGDADSPGRFVGWLASQQPVLARPIVGAYHDIGNHETLAEARSFYASTC